MSPPRLLLYNDGAGLGHRARNLKIAGRLISETPGARALVMSPSADALGQRLPPGIELLELPTIAGQVEVGRYEPLIEGGDLAALSAERGEMIRRAAARFRPDVMLVDNLPRGFCGDLLPTLEMFHAMRQRPKLLLGLRDVLHEPPSARITSWRRGGEYEAIAAYYDRVLVYGAESIVATAERYGFAEAAAGKLRYCGYVAPDGSPIGRERARSELGLGDEKLIVVTGGGGADALVMMRRCVAALEQLTDCVERAILIAGPRMSARDQIELQGLVRTPMIELLPAVENSLALFSAADLLITMAGYNTLTEALFLGCRVLAVPRVWATPVQGNRVQELEREGRPGPTPPPASEQTLRAGLFGARGLIDVADPRASAGQLARAIRRRLEAAPVPSAPLPLDGLAAAVAEIRNLAALDGAGRAGAGI